MRKPSEQTSTNRELLDANRNSADETNAGLEALLASIVAQGIADSASIAELPGGGQVETRLSTDDLAATADQLQYTSSQGPCLEVAFGNEAVMLSGDVAADERWPIWGPAAAAIGVGAAVSVELSSSAGPMGALNLFHRNPQTFTSDDIHMATLLGGHLSVELAHARHDEQLWKAIDARHVVGLAQGVIMHAYQVDSIVAFSVLRRLSQQTNTKLGELAAEIARTRKLPTTSP